MDLERHKGKDQRPATGPAHGRVLTPFQVKGAQPKLEICFAEVQWSWAQITALGGMNPDDPRLAQGPAVDPCPNPGKAAAYRKERLQPLDLSAYPGFDQPAGPIGSTAQKAADGTPLRPHLKDHSADRLPVVYLHDALAIAESLLEQYKDDLLVFQQTLLELPLLKDVPGLDPAIAAMDEKEKSAYYRCAQMAYRLFYDPLAFGRKGKPNQYLGDEMLDYDSNDAVFERCTFHTDQRLLENILKIDKRQEQRRALYDTKRLLVDFLNAKKKGGPITGIHPDFVDVNAALKDFANLNGDAYGLLWTKFNHLTSFMNHDPAMEDHDCTPTLQTRKEQKENTCGAAYMRAVCAPDHPLHAMLFPKEADIDVLSNNTYTPPEKAEPADGTGAFRCGAFAAIQNVPVAKAAKTLLKLNKQIIGDILVRMQKQWIDAPAQSQTALHVRCVVRLAKATGQSPLNTARVIPTGTRIRIDGKEHIVTGLTSVDLEKLNKKAFKNMGPNSAATKQAAKSFKFKPVYVDGHPMGTLGTGPGEKVAYSANAPRITQKQWMAMYAREVKEGATFYRANCDLIVIKKIGKTIKQALNSAKKKLPVPIAMFEMYNFTKTIHTIFNQDDIKLKEALPKAVLSASAVTYYTLDAVKSIIDEKVLIKGLNFSKLKAGDLLFKHIIELGDLNINLYSLWSVSLTMATSFWLLYETKQLIGHHDYDAAAACGVAAAATFGLALCKIGAAQLEVAGVGFLVFMAGWGWFFLTLAIGASICCAILKDSPMEIWAKYGPFAKDPDDRFTRQWEHKTPTWAYDSLMAITQPLHPVIKYAKSDPYKPPELVVECFVPTFSIGHWELEVHTSVQKIRKMEKPMLDDAFQPPEELKDRKQHLQKSLRIEKIVQDKQVVGVRYYYKNWSPQADSYYWRTRVRGVRKEDGKTLNLPPFIDNTIDWTQKQIDPDDKGWFYAETR